MKIRNIVLIAILIFALIQVIEIDLTNPDVIPENDLINYSKASDEISLIIKQSCFDCHSNETVYPWYSQLEPISWLLKNHVDEGRKHLNFSEWVNYSEDKKIALKEECIEEIEKDKMPLKSYTFIHTNAKLKSETKAALINWLNDSITKD